MTAEPATSTTTEPRTIRRAMTGDAAGISEIYAHYVAESFATFDELPPTVGAWAERLSALDASGHPVLVAAAASGDVIGYAYVAPWKPKHAYRATVENSIYLAPSAAGTGLGRRLLAGLIDACRDAGHTEIIAVISDRGSDASLALHEHAGFRRVGRLENVGCKFGTWLGVHLLQYSVM
ncbi:GNAT family N-acetyltransferase [Paramicrobacterium agarici]|uniref:Phosphinothricin acetyltransferase n=1 Tax=Paramicrobacterium agarici TaxID=630514 RepID=A0A2A9DY32_9MICO|nr:GNAT family N-acetyltransferase [Microbacterium agarici]PFG30892.1 phosphinothricin acetyltransferase [Microbacterium agarici]